MTYHSLLVESHRHYSVLLCLHILGNFPALLRASVRAATVVDGLETLSSFLRDRWHRPSSSRCSSASRADGVSACSPIRARPPSCNNGKLAIVPPPAPAVAMQVPVPVLAAFLDPLESTSVSGSTSGSASTSMSTPVQVGMWGAEVGSRLETLNEMEG